VFWGGDERFGDMRREGWDWSGNPVGKKRHWDLTLIKRSAGAEYARRTTLGREEERGRIRGRILM
jgi:hypothetical protein